MEVSPITPVIPETIVVHLGAPDDTSALNVEVPFIDYIKNVASSEIYPTWPENAIRANMYAQISFALNRIYTEYYRSRGYDFDITNNTRYDQYYVYGRDVYENISRIADDIFNEYLTRPGSVAPFFSQYCNGTTVTCDGLSQWGTVPLANQGKTPYEILTFYYGPDLNIRTAPVAKVLESYPGFPLKLGSGGNEVKTIQTELNRISNNFPNIPKIPSPDGFFGKPTEDAVKQFQKTFNLTSDGIVGKSTWYKIKRIFNGVKNLNELSSEGLSIEEVEPEFTTQLEPGSVGEEVKIIQYYLNIISYYNPTIPSIPRDGRYGPLTEEAVVNFQRFYGLNETGVVDRETWSTIQNVYDGIVQSLPVGYEDEGAELYPGYFLKKGMEDRNIQDLQNYLNTIADVNPNIPRVPATGFFGDLTENQVIAFQADQGIRQSGIVGPITWARVAELYNEIKGFKPPIDQ